MTVAETTLDAERYLGIQQGAVDTGRALRDLVNTAVEHDGAQELVFMGTGGVNLLMDPAVRFAEAYTRFPVRRRYAAEFIASGLPALDETSLVVIPSLSGTTKETLEVAKLARDAGARIIALTGNESTPLEDLAHATLINPAADDTSSESYYLQTLIGVTGLPGMSAAPDLGAEFAALPAQLLDAKLGYGARAEELAQFLNRAKTPIFTAAGSSYSEAYYFAMCILEEMQWIPTRPVHASDFFHGTLELVEPGVSVVLLNDTTEYRPLADRVAAFATRHTEQFASIDAAEVSLRSMSEQAIGLAAPVVLAALLERVAARLEVLRDHPLTTRRYYRREDY